MENQLGNFRRGYQFLSALVGWLGLGIIFYVMTAHKGGLALAAGVINYLSYFTILSNIFVAVTFTVAFLKSQSRFGKLLSRPDVRTGIGIYITVTGLVYLFILSKVWQPRDVEYVGNVLLHYVVPVLYIFDWLVFVPKGDLQYRNILSWLVFPLAYAVYTLVHGALTEFYPYFFLNAAKLGYAKVLFNSLCLMVGFIVLGFLLVALDRRLGKKRR